MLLVIGLGAVSGRRALLAARDRPQSIVILPQSVSQDDVIVLLFERASRDVSA